MRGPSDRPNDPQLDIPDKVRSDFGPSEADFVCLIPNEVACERVAFGSLAGDSDRPPAYEISLKDLRARPEHWVFHLSEKRTRPGFRPALDLLLEELDRRRAD